MNRRLLVLALPAALLTPQLNAEEATAPQSVVETQSEQASDPEPAAEQLPDTESVSENIKQPDAVKAIENTSPSTLPPQPVKLPESLPEQPEAHEEQAKQIAQVPELIQQPSPVITELSALIENHRYSEAYQYAQDHRSEWEGDGEFDFNYGVAAAQIGHYNEAIFPFERLLEEYPNNARFRLELARCHYFLNNLTVAETEFKRIAAQNPPDGVQKHIDRFLSRIAEQRQQVSPSWHGGIDVAAGYDSNINAATDLDAVQATFYLGDTSLSGLLSLNEEQKAKESAYGQVQGYVLHQRPITKRSNIDISLSGSYKDNTENDDYDLANTALSGGFRMIRGAHNLRFGGVYRQYWLAGEDLQTQILGNTRWQWLFAPKWKTGIHIEAGHQDNSQNDALDFLQWQSKFNLSRSSEGFSQNFQLSVGADEASKDENKFQGRSYIGLGYQARQALSESSQLYALLNYRDSQYQDEFDGLHPFYANEKREDQLTQLILGWNYAFNKNIGAKVQLNHSQNDSNLELYEYDRTQIEAGANFRF